MFRFRAIQWIVLSSVFVFEARVAFARAGGGGGYSSGSSRSSSSSASSSSYSSAQGSGEAGLIDLVVFVLVAGLILLLRRHGRRLMAERARTRSARQLALISRIQERDPDFDLETFEQRISRAFLRIQEGWSKQDLSDVRGFMSDGLYERFSIQLREQKEAGYFNRMSDVRVLGHEVVAVHPRAHFDVVSVRITAAATDVRVDVESGREIDGTRRAETFAEIWRFLRGREAATKAAAGLFEGQCPNCAAPIDPRRGWACRSCGSQLEGAPPDWVLVGITQVSEWSQPESDEPDWLKAAVGRDPGLTVEQLEDRASVLFWRLMDSERTGRLDELAHLCRGVFLERQEQRMAVRATRTTVVMRDCAIGSVRLRGILPGDQWDLALVEIRWSGDVLEVRSGEAARETGGRILRRSLLVMARRAGVQSDLGRAIVSAHCVRCGAPDEGPLEGRCGFCGEALDDGRDWLIERFLELESAEASQLCAEVVQARFAAAYGEAPGPVDEPGLSAARPGGEELLGWCLALAYCDGRIDRRELEELERLGDRLGVPADRARRLRQAAQFGRLEVEAPRNPAEAREWIEALTTLAAVDGPLGERELATIADLAGRVGIEVPG
ncbi:MAG TPA: Tim44 domain-containing protein [Deltaproteobacteria bacterium]|nr:Tim44 domain-containing protein [Deltaproteobacteria bacterium]